MTLAPMRPAALAPAQSTQPQRSRLTLGLFVAATGLVLIAGGLSQRGSSWVLPDGIIGGGIALVVCAPFARSLLDPLVVACPFMFFALAPGVGLVTAGSSDILLPLIVAILAASAAVGTATSAYPPVRAALPFTVAAVVLALGSMVAWTVLKPDFLASRAVSETAKLGIGVVYLFVVFLMVRRIGAERTGHALMLWAWTATALAVVSVVGAAVGVDLLPSDGFRALGFFYDPNLYAGYFLVSLSVIFYLADARPGWWTVVQAGAVVIGVVSTGSRGGILSLGVLLLFVVIAVPSLRIRLWLLAGTAGLIGGYFWLLQSTPATTILGLDRLLASSDEATVADDPRLGLWSLAFEKWRESPVVGIGAGQYERFSGEAYRTLSSGFGYVTHNTFLFFLVSYGIVGLLLFVAFLGWVVRSIQRAPHLTRAGKQALTSGVVVLAAHMMTLNLQNLRYVWIYFGLALGLALTTPPERGAANTSKPSNSSRGSTATRRPQSSGRKNS